MKNTALIDQENMSSLAGKYLTFQLAEEVYCIAVPKVQEIMWIMDITQVPQTPEFIRGVINLRGRVIPVVDLRLKFALEKTEDTAKTCIIVLQIESGHESLIMSIIVDEVNEVLDIKKEQIEPPPSFNSNIDTGFILGMGRIENDVVIMLDMDKVLASDEVGNIEQVAQPA
jgi:purine-binding chemotaxis protein CheW